MSLFCHMCTKFGEENLIDAKYHCTKFHANISLQDWIIITFWNLRWRPSAILDFRKTLFLSNGPLVLPIFCHVPNLVQKNVDRRRNYGQKSKSKMVEIGQVVRPGREPKKLKKARKETYMYWVFAQTTHVDAAICSLACRVVFGRFQVSSKSVERFWRYGGDEFRHLLYLIPMAYITACTSCEQVKFSSYLFTIITIILSNIMWCVIVFSALNYYKPPSRRCHKRCSQYLNR